MIRITLRKVVKLVLLLVFFVFVLSNLLALGRGGMLHVSTDDVVVQMAGSHDTYNGQPALARAPVAPRRPGGDVENDNTNTLLSTRANGNQSQSADMDTSLPELNRSLILVSILNHNKHQKIRNADLLAADFAERADAVTIVVQVHKRPAYLRHLVDSLSRAKFIERTLVIFSHDYHSSVLNDIVESITSFPVLQIFYPYSMQLYPKEFPGEHPNDCPRNINRHRAKLVKCNNADFPDLYGHYREAPYTQTKHHWFWKMNQVFDKLRVMRGFTGMVLQLEEDHFVSADVLVMLGQMRRYREKACPQCGILTLGTYDKKPSYRIFSAKVEMSLWISAKHNLGMAMDAATWTEIKQCSEAFCTYDDYNWDWSLQFVGMSCIPGKLRAMVLRAPRVFHIGECGVHHKGKVCDPQTRVAQIDQLLSANSHYLFPARLTLLGTSKTSIRQTKPNGGWGDLRDRMLCRRFAVAK